MILPPKIYNDILTFKKSKYLYTHYYFESPRAFQYSLINNGKKRKEFREAPQLMSPNKS